MLDDHALEELFDQLKLTPEARAKVHHIRNSEPQRRVRSGKGNVTARYTSQKMKLTLQAESYKNELPYVRILDIDPNVFEIYDQPPSITINLVSRRGKRSGKRYTADYFVIRKDSISYVECKTEAQLEILSQQNPNGYYKDETGKWRYPPGEEYAAQFGFGFEVASSADINWNFQRNVDFLGDFWLDTCPHVPEEVESQIFDYVKMHLGLYLVDLLDEFPDIPRDYIYSLIAHSTIYVDLESVPLTEPDRVRIFPDKFIAEAFITDRGENTYGTELHSVVISEGSTVLWDDRLWTIINVGATKVSLLSEDQTILELFNHHVEKLVRQGKLTGKTGRQDPNEEEAFEILSRASRKDLDNASARWRLITPYLDGSPLSKDLETRMAKKIYRYRTAYQTAARKYGSRYAIIGLLPRFFKSGNRNPRIDRAVREMMEEVIENDFETIKRKNYRAVFGKLRNSCNAHGLQAPSYKTFVKYCKKRDSYRQKQKREGSRAAYDLEPWYWELSYTTPRHGERVFQICHLDHTELNIELIHSVTKKNLGRPWVTFLIDAYSRRILVVYISFDPPSYRTLMMVMREVVRRYGRLPKNLVVDQGKEFSSAYFEIMLAQYGVTKLERPAAKPRHGNICERLFGTAETEFIYALTGNTQNMQNVRQVTKSVNPKEHAVWTLRRLYERLQEWAYEVYDTRKHPVFGRSPRIVFQESLMDHGLREHTLIPYDEAFKFSTLPTTSKGTAKVQPNKGVRINYFDYWSERMRDPEVENTDVEIRYDPYNLGIAYAYIKGHWVKCISSHFTQTEGRSEKWLRLAAQELRQRNKVHHQNFPVRASELARFEASLEAEEAELQRMRDSEASTIIFSINGESFEATGSLGERGSMSNPTSVGRNGASADETPDTDPIHPSSATRPRRDLPVI